MTLQLAEARTALAEALAAVDGVTVYKFKPTNFTWPAAVVNWPDSMDVRPTMDGASTRDYVIPVDLGVAVKNPAGADEKLCELIEAVVAELQDNPQWDVRVVTDFGDELLADQRVVLWCRLPVAVWE